MERPTRLAVNSVSASVAQEAAKSVTQASLCCIENGGFKTLCMPEGDCLKGKLRPAALKQHAEAFRRWLPNQIRHRLELTVSRDLLPSAREQSRLPSFFGQGSLKSENALPDVMLKSARLGTGADLVELP